MNKTLHFISGLPRAGSTMVTQILKQNPDIHGEAVSSLSSIFGTTHVNWNLYEQNKYNTVLQIKHGVLKGILNGYYSHVNKPNIIDNNVQWIQHIGLLENVLNTPIKMVCMVRNPAEILTSFEKLRKNNLHIISSADQNLRETSTVASRAYFYAGPTGMLGLSHAHLKDAIVMGHKDKLLFVDYNRFCNSPRSQTKRIYEFLGIPEFDHNFKQLDKIQNLPEIYNTKSSVDRTTVNCVEYLGLDLYQQYNAQIFWDAWI